MRGPFQTSECGKINGFAWKAKGERMAWVIRSSIAVVIVTALALAGWLAMRALEIDMVRETRYADWATVAALEVPERDWLPAWLPPSAMEIYDRHCTDCSAGWGRFTFDVNDIAECCAQWKPVAVGDSTSPRAPHTTREEPWPTWWPKNFDKEFRALPKYTGGEFTFAIDEVNGLIYFWARH